MLSQFGLTDPGWADEKEAPNWPVTFIKAGPVTPDRPAHGFDGLLLADNLAFKRVAKPFKRSISEAPILDTGIPVIRSTAAATSLGVATTRSDSEWSLSWSCNLATWSLASWAAW